MPELELSKIRLTGWNPRKTFDQESLDELKASIQQFGILEPIVVRPAGHDCYELVAGERRFRAASQLNLAAVPAVIKDLSDRDVREIMLIENLQRSSLEPLEEAVALDRLLHFSDCDTTQDELAKKLGKSQAWIANRLRLLQAPQEVKDLIISREISPKHALALLPFAKFPVLEDIISRLKDTLQKQGKISVQSLEKMVVDVVVYGNENVFNLDDISYEYDHLEQYLQLDDCKNCKDIIVAKNWRDDNERYCLNRRCWKDKVNIAKQKHEKAMEAARNKLAAASGEDIIVDTSKLSWDQYSHLSELDKSGCKACDYYRLSTTNKEICLDRDCLRKKQTAFTKAKNKAAKQKQQQLFDAVDSWLDEKPQQLANTDFRQILRLLMHWSWVDSIKIGLAPWGKCTNEEERLKTIENIPESELQKALFRLVIVHTLFTRYGGHHITPERLLETMPDIDLKAFPGVIK